MPLRVLKIAPILKSGFGSTDFSIYQRGAGEAQPVGAQHTSGVACFVGSDWFIRATASALQEYGRKGFL
jgi:hypothetical protein